jgi:hypothetical protein
VERKRGGRPVELRDEMARNPNEVKEASYYGEPLSRVGTRLLAPVDHSSIALDDCIDCSGVAESTKSLVALQSLV